MIIQAGGGLKIDCLLLGDFMVNCYVLTLPDEAAGGATPCWVVDPGLSPEPLLAKLEEEQLAPQRILLTHGHFDHTAGIEKLKMAHPAATITIPAGDAHMLTDSVANLSSAFAMTLTLPLPEQTVTPGEELTLGSLSWRVLDVAGHSPGGVAFYCEAAAVVLTGDSLMTGSIGRSDFPGGDAPQLLANIRANLMTLPDETRILPGHGSPSSIGDERTGNPYVR